MCNFVFEKGWFRLVHTDHFPSLLTLNGLHWEEEGGKQEKQVCWNLEKEKGWNRYQVLSDECSEALDKVIEDDKKR